MNLHKFNCLLLKKLFFIIKHYYFLTVKQRLINPTYTFVIFPVVLFPLLDGIVFSSLPSTTSGIMQVVPTGCSDRGKAVMWVWNCSWSCERFCVWFSNICCEGTWPHRCWWYGAEDCLNWWWPDWHLASNTDGLSSI